MAAEQPATGLSQNPVDGSWGYACQEHGLTRLGLTEQHALNVERKHLREDHADQADAVEVDLTAGAEVIAEFLGSDAKAYQAAMKVWRAMTPLAPRVALETPTRAAVMPF